MGANTKIEWADHTWNPWMGCTKVGPPCDFCYAEEMMDHRYGRVTWGAGQDRVRTSASNWKEPFKWDRAAAAAGETATVFCLSLGDIWDNEVDPLVRHQAFDVMERTPHLLYLLLSKRIGNAVKMCDPLAGNRILPKNAALGATMATQEEWDRDLPKLKHAADILNPRFTFASVEPMLGLIDARGNLPDWVIVGGESGQHARPMHPDWARSMRDQCQAAGVPFFLKQWGEHAPATLDAKPGEQEPWRIYPDGRRMWGFDEIQKKPEEWPRELMVRVGKKAAGALLDGREHKEFPA